jgi:hypothetical protein
MIRSLTLLAAVFALAASPALAWEKPTSPRNPCYVECLKTTGCEVIPSQFPPAKSATSKAKRKKR